MPAETVIIPLYNINWLVFTAQAVYLKRNEVNFRLQAMPWLTLLIATLLRARPCDIYGI
jgi:hypothetical protein